MRWVLLGGQSCAACGGLLALILNDWGALTWATVAVVLFVAYSVLYERYDVLRTETLGECEQLRHRADDWRLIAEVIAGSDIATPSPFDTAKCDPNPRDLLSDPSNPRVQQQRGAAVGSWDWEWNTPTSTTTTTTWTET